MRKSGWTPSIVPNGDDQNVYIVVDDFGRKGRAYRETDVERTELEAVIICWKGSTRTRSAWSVSTPPSNGSRMSQAMLPIRCAAAATCNSATCRSFWKSSLSGTKAGITISSFLSHAPGLS